VGFPQARIASPAAETATVLRACHCREVKQTPFALCQPATTLRSEPRSVPFYSPIQGPAASFP
jgi:hypothetical protein